MTARKRISTKNTAKSSIALVEIGPDFGGLDGDQFSLRSAFDFDRLGLGGNLDNDGYFSDLEFNAQNIIAIKDTWVPMGKTLGTCNSNVNHDGETLSVDGNLEQNDQHIFIGWDISGMPNYANLSDASLKLKPLSTPLVSHTYTIYSLDGYEENWEEGSIKCSDGYVLGSQSTTYNQPANTNEITINLFSTFASYIESRIDDGTTCTLIIADEAVVPAKTTYETKDNNPNLGPRLTLKFNAPKVEQPNGEGGIKIRLL